MFTVILIKPPYSKMTPPILRDVLKFSKNRFYIDTGKIKTTPSLSLLSEPLLDWHGVLFSAIEIRRAPRCLHGNPTRGDPLAPPPHRTPLQLTGLSL